MTARLGTGAYTVKAACLYFGKKLNLNGVSATGKPDGCGDAPRPRERPTVMRKVTDGWRIIRLRLTGPMIGNI